MLICGKSEYGIQANRRHHSNWFKFPTNSRITRKFILITAINPMTRTTQSIILPSFQYVYVSVHPLPFLQRWIHYYLTSTLHIQKLAYTASSTCIVFGHVVTIMSPLNTAPFHWQQYSSHGVCCMCFDSKTGCEKSGVMWVLMCGINTMLETVRFQCSAIHTHILLNTVSPWT